VLEEAMTQLIELRSQVQGFAAARPGDRSYLERLISKKGYALLKTILAKVLKNEKSKNGREPRGRNGC
jgi:hypothetical protein